jgi:hypothetical protein
MKKTGRDEKIINNVPETLRMDRDRIRHLAREEGYNLISIFMPTVRKGTETEQNWIRFKNLLREAEKQLKGRGRRDSEVNDILKPAYDLLKNRSFLEHQREGLAVFMAPGSIKYYTLTESFNEKLSIGEKYFLKPLAPFCREFVDYYLLALSHNKTRLFRGNKYELRRIDTGDMIDNMDDFMKYEDPEKQLQFHTGTGKTSGRRHAMYHGHGAAGDDSERKEYLTRFFRIIDKGISGIISGGDSPLILAGIDYLIPLYREANSYSGLLDEVIDKNPDDMRPDELHRSSLDIIEGYYKRDLISVVSKYNDLKGTGRASADIVQVVKGAYSNRVDTLLIDPDFEVYGEFNMDNTEVNVRGGEEGGGIDLTELSFRETVLHDGDVYIIDPESMEDNERVAAIFRF